MEASRLRLASALAISAVEPTICVGGSGVTLSLDDGASWERFGVPDEVGPIAIDRAGAVYAVAGGYLFKNAERDRSWRTIDIASMSALAVVVDPNQPGTVFVGGYGGIAKSVDAGESWLEVVADEELEVSTLAIDPRNPESLYAGFEEGVLASVDGGTTWSTTALRKSITSLCVDAAGIVYACTLRKIFGTDDGGASWRRLAQPKGRVVSAVVADPHRPHVLYGSTSFDWAGLGDDGAGDDDPDASIARVGGGFGVVRSEDGAQSWHTAEAGLVLASVDGSTLRTPVLAVDPRRAETLYAATIASVFRSTDGGATWEPFGQRLETTRPASWLEIDRDGRTLYAGLESGSVHARALG